MTQEIFSIIEFMPISLMTGVSVGVIIQMLMYGISKAISLINI